MSPIITLMSSHGELDCRATDGVVVDIREDTDEESAGALSNIYSVDVHSLKQRIPTLENGGEVDILFAGIWYTTDRGSVAFDAPGL